MALVTKGGGGVLVTMVKRESKAVVKLMALRPNFELSKAKTHRPTCTYRYAVAEWTREESKTLKRC